MKLESFASSHRGLLSIIGFTTVLVVAGVVTFSLAHPGNLSNNAYFQIGASVAQRTQSFNLPNGWKRRSVDKRMTPKGDSFFFVLQSNAQNSPVGTIAFAFQDAPAANLTKLISKRLLEVRGWCPGYIDELVASRLPNLTASTTFMVLLNYPSPTAVRLMIFKQVTGGMLTIERAAMRQAGAKYLDQQSALVAGFAGPMPSPSDRIHEAASPTL